MSKEGWVTLTIIFGIIAVITAALLIAALKLLVDDSKKLKRLDLQIDKLQERYKRSRDQADTWEHRYMMLEAERLDEEELEEGEDYVRRSLGYPDEDEPTRTKEST